MKAAAIIIILVSSYYTFSFAEYNRQQGNKPAAAGIFLAIFSSIAIAVYAMFKA